MNEGPLLEIRDLAVGFDGAAQPAVDGVSLSIFEGQAVALVGESGCGKSVTAMSVLRLLASPPARLLRGEVRFRSREGEVDLSRGDEARLRRVRGGEIAMIFQEPMTSLNPVFSIGEQIVEAVMLHREAARGEARRIAIEAMRTVGIPDPERWARQYPHQFSGGMRQRVMIAMALACRPRLLLADEPTTALDVTIQAQILDLLREARGTSGMAMLLITHDLGVVAENADVVCVIYAGRVVECADVFELYRNPLHPYTRGLLRCIPRLGERRDRLPTIREVISDEAEFRRLPGGLRPWWPGHEAPAGVHRGARECVLHEAAPSHFVGVWASGPEGGAVVPRLGFRRGAPAGAGHRVS